MRVLAASTGGVGHLGPLLPFVRGCAENGHDVLLAAPEPMRREDVPFAPLPDTPPERLGRIFGSLPGLPRDEANARVMREVFGGANVDATLAAHEALIAEWRPDVVLREVAELGSYVAATRAGVPIVQVAIGLRTVDDFLADTLAASDFAETYGVDTAPLRTARVLSLVPPSMEPAGPPREHYRDAGMTGTGGALPDGLSDDDRPLVYVTFGTVAAALPHLASVYRDTLDALSDLPVRVLMTVGNGGDPDALAPVPDNALVVRWVAQAAVLRHARAVVGHGGFGTTFGALAAGVPLAVLPLFSYDQYVNADAVAVSGAGRAVTEASGLRDAVRQLLDDDAARAAAGRVAAEMAALPPAADWVRR
ncbi:MAG TPA: glycosyltransferase [Frankiaceae bacterium]|nr:glycosyltransferase [Frankiaceae bacterium]